MSRWSEEEVEYLLSIDGTLQEKAEKLSEKFNRTFTKISVRNKLLRTQPVVSIKEEIERDEEKIVKLTEKRDTGKKYKFALEENRRLKAELEAAIRINESHSSHIISCKEPSGTNEAVAVVVASDWHCEESVDPENVSGINEYNLEIARKSADNFFRKAVRLLFMFRQDVQIDTLVLALLGDFISGNIHEENVETALLPPVEAALFAQELIESGIDYLIQKTNCQIIVPCVSGNHSRITEKRRSATRAGNSLEYFIYKSMAERYKNSPRVHFIIPRNQFAFVEIYGKVLRFQHGDSLRYQGGVGDIFVPVNRQIPKWNNVRQADFDIFGHFHRRRDGGNFISNGSLIGYNAYAQNNGFGYEVPQQEMFLWDKHHGRSIMSPIFVRNGDW
jgi:hypothetical protein